MTTLPVIESCTGCGGSCCMHAGTPYGYAIQSRDDLPQDEKGYLDYWRWRFVPRHAKALVRAAVLHHDDCLAAREGQRKDLADSAQEMATALNRLSLHCPVLTGQIQTAHSRVRWSDEPTHRYAPFSFGTRG